MNPPLYYYPHMEMKYGIFLEEQKRISETAKERLMAIDPAQTNTLIFLNQFTDPKYAIANEIRCYYGEAIFFHDDETLDKVKRLISLTPGVKFNIFSRWFISLQDIHKQYETIRQQDIKVDSLFSFTIIKTHLISKFRKEISMAYMPAVRDNIRMSKLTKDLINLKKRRNYSNSNPKRYKDIYEIYINDAVNEYANIPNEKLDLDLKFNIDAFIDISKGRTESSYLRILLEECFASNNMKMTKTRFLSIVFDLFKLLMPDRIFMDEKTFDKESSLTYKSYDSYKAHVLKKILYPKQLSR